MTARCFPSKENKDTFIFQFCSLMNLNMYIINKLFHGYFAYTIFIHSLRKTNSLAALVRLFCTTCEITYKYTVPIESSILLFLRLSRSIFLSNQTISSIFLNSTHAKTAWLPRRCLETTRCEWILDLGNQCSIVWNIATNVQIW